MFGSLSFRSAIMGYMHILGFALNQSWSGVTSTLISSMVLMFHRKWQCTPTVHRAVDEHMFVVHSSKYVQGYIITVSHYYLHAFQPLVKVDVFMLHCHMRPTLNNYNCHRSNLSLDCVPHLRFDCYICQTS